MPDETNIAWEADEYIDHEHREDLIRHRVPSRVEIDPEIREERHTESTHPDRERRWEECECEWDKKSCRDKEYYKSLSTHAWLDLWSSLIEEDTIHREMEYTAMEELEGYDRGDQPGDMSERESIKVESKNLNNPSICESDQWDGRHDEDECMWEGPTRVKRNHKKNLKYNTWDFMSFC